MDGRPGSPDDTLETAEDRTKIHAFVTVCEEEARKAADASASLFGGGASMENVPTLEVSEAELNEDARVSTMLVRSGLCKSQSDARKQIEQNAVSLDDSKVTDPAAQISVSQLKEDGILLKKGKKGFCRIKLA